MGELSDYEVIIADVAARGSSLNRADDGEKIAD